MKGADMNQLDSPHELSAGRAHNVCHPQKSQLLRTLKTMGFRAADNRSSYRRNGLSVSLRPHWLVAKTAAAADIDPLHGQLGSPGLWKIVADGDGLSREFHLPLACLFSEQEEMLDEDSVEGADPFQDCLQWIAAAAAGELPAGWQCPPPSEIESWLPPGGLTVQSGPLLCQGSLCCEPNCLRLRFPLAAPVDRERLAPARLACLRDVLIDAQNRWNMVRVGMFGTPRQATPMTEVDLSGAPSR